MYADEDRSARIVLCMIYSAVRIGELFDIECSNVHLPERYIIGGKKTEAGKNRTIPIREEIAPYIEQFLNENNKYLIGNTKGQRMNEANFLKRDFYPLLERLNIQYKDENGKNVLTPHRTRHTYISESIKAGITPDALTKIVGHANYSTSVNKYNKEVDIEYLKKEAKKGM